MVPRTKSSPISVNKIPRFAMSVESRLPFNSSRVRRLRQILIFCPAILRPLAGKPREMECLPWRPSHSRRRRRELRDRAEYFPENIRLDPAIHAAAAANAMVSKEGIPFREAYRQVAAKLQDKK